MARSHGVPSFFFVCVQSPNKIERERPANVRHANSEQYQPTPDNFGLLAWSTNAVTTDKFIGLPEIHAAISNCEMADKNDGVVSVRKM